MCKQIWFLLWILPIDQWNELQQLFCIQEYNMKNAKRGFLKMFTVQCTLYTEKPICTIRIKVYFTYIKWHRQWTPKKNRDRPWCSAFQRKRLGFLGSTSADKREARIYLNQRGKIEEKNENEEEMCFEIHHSKLVLEEYVHWTSSTINLFGSIHVAVSKE